MWLFTVYGFYSVSVQRRTAIVRARMRSHLEALQKRFRIKGTIVTTQSRDYSFRLSVPLQQWSLVMRDLTAEQSWSNFKNEASARHGKASQYVAALHKVWHEMAKLQPTPPYCGRVSKYAAPKQPKLDDIDFNECLTQLPSADYGDQSW